MNTPEPIRDRIAKNNIFRDQNVSHKDENWILIKNGIEYFQCNFSLPFFVFLPFFDYGNIQDL